MRVIYFSLDYTPHDHRFLSALAETEHEVYYVRLQRGPRQMEDRPVPANIQQVQWAGGKGEFRWSRLPRLVRDFHRLVHHIKPDIVHAGPIQTCGLIATLAGARPRLIMSWGFDLMQDDERNAWWRWATKFVLRRADYFTSDCEATRNKAIAHGMDPRRTIVFPWGVDLQKFSPPVSPRKPARKQGFTLLCNRSWEPRYGLDVLARAFVKVAQARQDVVLLLLGDGSLAARLQQIFTQAGITDRVHYGGRVTQSDLPRFYHSADIFISPSHVDGSSISLLEALACGVPVIVSDIPANLEWVSDGVNGWLFPDGSEGALAAKILTVLAQPQTMLPIQKAARSTAEARADWGRNFPKLLEAYRLAGIPRKDRPVK